MENIAQHDKEIIEKFELKRTAARCIVGMRKRSEISDFVDKMVADLGDVSREDYQRHVDILLAWGEGGEPTEGPLFDDLIGDMLTKVRGHEYYTQYKAYLKDTIQEYVANLAVESHQKLKANLKGNRVHLFDMTMPVVLAVSVLSDADSDSTLLGMEQMNLLHLPFPDTAIRIAFPIDPTMTFTFCYNAPLVLKRMDVGCLMVTGTLLPPVYIESPREPLRILDPYATDKLAELTPRIASAALTTLLVALATRNIVKRDRLAGKNARQLRGLQAGYDNMTYLSRTVVEMPVLSVGEGPSPRAHLRRGHAHTVRFGKLWSERRMDWFPPIFVNADPTFIEPVKNYKMTN